LPIDIQTEQVVEKIVGWSNVPEHPPDSRFLFIDGHTGHDFCFSRSFTEASSDRAQSKTLDDSPSGSSDSLFPWSGRVVFLATAEWAFQERRLLLASTAMLEHQRLAFRPPTAQNETDLVYEISDAEAAERIGVVRQTAKTAGVLSRWLFRGSATSRLDIREAEDEPLVFSIGYTPRLFGSEITIADADDNPIGFVKASSWTRGNPLWVYDRNHVAFARITGSWNRKDIAMRGPSGRELARIRGSSEPSPSQDSFVVSIDDQLADEPFAKMLLLGGVLGLRFLERS
jgi:hypothetical protein